jgi:hypothetical protein
MRRNTTIMFLFAILLSMFSCTREFGEHYSIEEETVNSNIWDALRENPEFSSFVDYMEMLEFDTLFDLDHSYTLFVPNNAAFESFVPVEGFLDQTLLYHISRTVFLTRNVEESRKLETVSGKYVSIDRDGYDFLFDSIPIVFSSPMHLDGKYYEISKVAYPRPNLYEYTGLYSTVIKDYIDAADSVYLDRQNSTPLGFDDQGNTIYDSVYGVVNLFEKYFFPVSKEFRDRSATLLIFNQTQYEQALDIMANDLGGVFSTHEDIPLEWQQEVFLPGVLADGMFHGILPFEEFLKTDLINIQGDSVKVDYLNIDPASRFLCSNGIVYRYTDFIVDDTLYMGNITVPGEELVDSISTTQNIWKEEVSVSGEYIDPVRTYYKEAWTEYILSVTFKRNYRGDFILEFPVKHVFPGRYRLEWRGNYRPGGEYAVYANGEKLGEFDTYKFRRIITSVTGDRFFPDDNGYNTTDFWVENIDTYGDVMVRFEYLGPGSATNNGFSLDYIRLIPDRNE